MLLFALTIQALFASASPAAQYNLLPENSHLQCLHSDDSLYGFLFERATGSSVRVSIITKGLNEGEKSAFTADIVKSTDDALYMKHQSRRGEFGRVVQFALGKKVNPELGPKLPGLFAEATIFYSKDEQTGLEIPEAHPEGSFLLQCDFPNAN